MRELKLYTVSDEYVQFLNKCDRRVSSNKENNRNFERKYIGMVLNVDKIDYFVPLASPKETDYYLDEAGNKRIRRSIISIIRMVHKESNGNLVLLGTIKFNNMIPVVDSEVHQYDIQIEPNMAYRDLLYKEWNFIRLHKDEIYKNARVIYNQKINNVDGIGYLKNTVDFKLLELKSREYIMQKQSIKEVAITDETIRNNNQSKTLI